MTNAILDGPDVMAELLGERQRATHQPRDPLASQAVETLHRMGLAGELGDRAVLSWREDIFVVY